jgi:hypothetical protein
VPFSPKRMKFERGRSIPADGPNSANDLPDIHPGSGGRFPQAPENPTALYGSAGFLRLLCSPAMPAHSGRGRAVLRRCGWKRFGQRYAQSFCVDRANAT